MATKEQLRKIRQKYHLGEYRGKKTRHHTQNKYNKEVNMAKKRRHTSRGKSSGSSIMGTAVGVGGYILYEALLQPKVQSIIGIGLMENVAELAIGVWLSRKGGVVGNIGKAAIVLNSYQIIKPLLAGISGSTTSY